MRLALLRGGVALAACRLGRSLSHGTGLGRGPREVILRCQHYFAAANVVAHSSALLTLPRTYAEGLIRGLPLVLRELQAPIPPMGIWMYWHADREGDPVHRWMRTCVGEAACQAMRDVHDLR